VEINVSELQNYLSMIFEQIRHENDLLNHRTTWMLTVQGLLFAALALFLKDRPNRLAASIVCLIGIVSCVSMGYSLWVGARLLNELNIHANELSSIVAKNLSIKAIKTTATASYAFLLPWKLLPWFFAVVWFILSVLVNTTFVHDA